MITLLDPKKYLYPCFSKVYAARSGTTSKLTQTAAKTELGHRTFFHQMESSQKNHLFAASFGLGQFEELKINVKMNHFAMKRKIYMAALKATWAEVQLRKC